MATGHGHTPAAWTSVTIMFVGCLIGAVAVVLANIPLLIGAGVVILLGAVTGKVMAMMGLGAPEQPRQPSQASLQAGSAEQARTTPTPTAPSDGRTPAQAEEQARVEAPTHHPAGPAGSAR